MSQDPRRRAGSEEPVVVVSPVNRFTRRRFIEYSFAGTAGVTIASVLAACGGGGGVTPTAAPAKPAESKPAESKPAEAAKPADKPAQAGPGGFSGGGSLTLLMRAHFVPAFDTWFDKWAKDWGDKNKVNVTVDHILAGEIPAKIAAEVAAGSGHDLYGFPISGMGHLYSKQLVDVSDVVKPLGEKYGGWVLPLAENVGSVDGVWRTVPEYFIEFGVNYRKDLFDANSLKVPDTWDDLLKAGTTLKEKGNPIGIAVNQKSNDANNSWNGLLWCYGASYVAKDAKTVAINSPETKQAVEMAIELYKKTMTDEVLSWDDSGNNQGLASGRLSWINNPISSYLTIEKQDKALADKIYIALPPGGPKERVASVSNSHFGIFTFSKNAAAAKAFIVDYFAIYPEAVKASEAYNQPMLKDFRKKPMPGLGDNPKFAILQDFDQLARTTGYPGPPTQAASEVEANWIVPLMIGQAVQSGNAGDAISWAESKLKAIYDKYK